MSIIFEGKKTEKTDKIVATTLGSSTKAKTAEDGRLCRVGCQAKATVKFFVHELPSVYS